jgi:hypothetical protein
MILPELLLPSRRYCQWTNSGLDSIDFCVDKTHYLSYPFEVNYHYNSRGFRDAEWPADLSDVIWCIGDSFTVGIGSPIEHTWPWLLNKRTNKRTINISMDGASNNWIARVAADILAQVPQAVIVTHWSFLHRRELTVEQALQTKFLRFYNSVRDKSWPDCNNVNDIDELPDYIKMEIVELHKWTDKIYDDDRALHYMQTDRQEDIDNTQNCIQQLNGRVVHTSIPSWAPVTEKLNFKNVILTRQLDRARDGHHYDILTSTALVDRVVPALAQYIID